MEFCIKTLGQIISSALLVISNFYLWILSSANVLDESMKYVTFVIGIVSGIVYITLVVLKKRKEKKEIQRIDLEITLSELEIEKLRKSGSNNDFPETERFNN